MHVLDIDLETYCSVPIKDSGSYKYTQSPDFEILLLAWSYDGSPVQVIDLAQGERIPEWMISAIRDPRCIKKAHNAAFEISGLAHFFGPLIPSQWRCSQFHALFAGYPAKLEAVGEALGLSEDKKKLATGKALIRYFCMPCKPTKANGYRARNLPEHAPEKWDQFVEYNRRDVETEMEIERRLSRFAIPRWLQKQWETDLIINSRGVMVDMDLVNGALAIAEAETEKLTAEAVDLTGLDNPNSLSQLSGWLSARGVEMPDMTKDTVSRTLSEPSLDPVARRVLEIRQELGKTSTKKYVAMQRCAGADGRARGLIQFYGANRTGRWAGRLIQVQNLPRTYTKNIEFARELVKGAKGDALTLIYGSAQDTLSQLIRTALIASPGNVLVDADFSAIEARVISWLAGETWRIRAFENGEDIYCASASQMFGVEVKKHGPNGHLRAKGKIAELALGYQGSVGAMINMGALDMGLTEEELPGIVDQWRDANPRIRQLWYDMQTAAERVIQNAGSVCINGKVTLSLEYNPDTDMTYMSMLLPSGRKLYYPGPKIGTNRFGGASITYMGVHQEKKKWMEIETYGGKLVENAVQAIARDCLAYAIENIEAAGLPIVFHVHDEVVIDTPRFGSDEEMLRKVTDIMARPAPWAQGLPLDAAGWVGDFFTKD